MTKSKYTLEEIESFLQRASDLILQEKILRQSAKDKMKLSNQFENAFLMSNKKKVNKSLNRDLLYADICRNLFKSIMFRLSN